MLKRDCTRHGHVMQMNKKKRPTSILAVASRFSPDSTDISIFPPLNSNCNSNIKQYKPLCTPKSDISSVESVVFSVSSTSFQNDHELFFEYQPSIADFSEKERLQVLTTRIKQCFKMCNFSDPRQKEKVAEKTKTLQDIHAAIKKTNILEKFSNEEYQYLLRFFILYTNRSTSDDEKIKMAMIDNDKTMEFKEAAWDHISIVYNIMVDAITNRKFNQKICKASQLKKLCFNIVSLFSSPDVREREKLRKVYHICYVNFVQQRNLMKAFTNNFFIDVAMNDKSAVGVNELLLSFFPVVSGFKVPLFAEHQINFSKVILPLHKHRYLPTFHVGLVNVITAYCDKQRNLGYEAIDYLLSTWPKTCPTKEMNYLMEVIHLIEVCGPEFPKNIIIGICLRVAKCVNSDLFTLCERTMMMWQSDTWSKAFSNDAQETFRIVLPELIKAVNTHWSEDVRKLAVTTTLVIKQSNPEIFQIVLNELKPQKNNSYQVKNVYDMWMSIAKIANLTNDEMRNLADKLKDLMFV